jgi:hypothetical protein
MTDGKEAFRTAIRLVVGDQGFAMAAAIYDALVAAEQRGYEAGYAQGAADEADFWAMEKQPRDVEPNEETIRAAERNLFDVYQMDLFPEEYVGKTNASVEG